MNGKTLGTIAAIGATDLVVIAEEHGAILTLLSIGLTFGLPWVGFKLGRYQRVSR